MSCVLYHMSKQNPPCFTKAGFQTYPLLRRMFLKGDQCCITNLFVEIPSFVFILQK